MPKTVLLIAHIEYQHFDRHTGRMEWVPKAPAAGFAPAYEPSDIDAMGSDITNINPFFRWGDAVAIRVRGVTRQVYGDDRTWSSPVVSAPDFERTLLPHDNLLIRSFPDAIVILSKLPAQTVPPFPGGDLTYASVCKSRLAGDNGLRNLLTAGWSGDMSEDSWVDRLVMEVLKLTGTYKAAPP